MCEQRSRENEIDGPIGDGQDVGHIVFFGHVVDLAHVAGPIKFETLGIKVIAAPVQHLLVNINSYVAASECFLVEVVVPEMMGKATATATYIQNVGVQAAKPGKKCVE